MGKGLCYHPQTHTPHDYFSNTHQSAKWDPNPHSLLQFSCPFSWLSIVKPPGYLDFERERDQLGHHVHNCFCCCINVIPIFSDPPTASVYIKRTVLQAASLFATVSFFFLCPWKGHQELISKHLFHGSFFKLNFGLTLVEGFSVLTVSFH